MFTGFSGGDSAQPSSQQQQLENNGAAAPLSTSAAAMVATPATSLGQGQGMPGQVYTTPTPPVGVALGVASAGGLLPSPAYGWLLT